MASDFIKKERVAFKKWFSSEMKIRREALGMTLEDVGRRIGVTRAQICAIEKMKTMPTFPLGIKLCAMFNIDPKDHFEINFDFQISPSKREDE